MPLEEIAKIFGDEVVMTLDEAGTAKADKGQLQRQSVDKDPTGAERVEELKT